VKEALTHVCTDLAVVEQNTIFEDSLAFIPFKMEQLGTLTENAVF